MHTDTNRIPIATAAEVAARLPYPHTISGGWYRTSTAICHGGDDKNALSFQDGDRPGESPLRVHCHSRNCDPPAIRHALQQATALWLCRCDACFAAFRAGQPPPGTDATPPQGAHQTSGRLRPSEWANRYITPKDAGNGAQGRSATGQGKNTSAYAAALWAVAHASTSGPAPQHPAAKWLADRSLWPPAEPLPAAVRWLPRSHRQFPRGRPDSTAAGALVMAMRPLDDPSAPRAKYSSSPSTRPAAKPATGRTTPTNAPTEQAHSTASSGAAGSRSQAAICTSAKASPTACVSCATPAIPPSSPSAPAPATPASNPAASTQSPSGPTPTKQAPGQ